MNGQLLLQIMNDKYPQMNVLELQIGELHREYRNIYIVKQIDESTINYCVQNKMDAILTHTMIDLGKKHTILLETEQGQMVRTLIQQQIDVYVFNSKLNTVENGISDWLADAFQLKNTKVLKNEMNTKLKKIAVYTPITHIQQIQDTLSIEGAGHIGNYSHCTFNIKGTGTFKPLEGTNPYLGSLNQLESVEEVKIESIIPEYKIDACIERLKEVHPYEEMAYDIYSLEINGKSYGFGRIGDIDQISLGTLLEQIKHKYTPNHIRYIGNIDQTIKKLAIVYGTQSDYIDLAIQHQVDCLVIYNFGNETIKNTYLNKIVVIELDYLMDNIINQQLKHVLTNEIIKRNISCNVVEQIVLESYYKII